MWPPFLFLSDSAYDSAGISSSSLSWFSSWMKCWSCAALLHIVRVAPPGRPGSLRWESKIRRTLIFSELDSFLSTLNFPALRLPQVLTSWSESAAPGVKESGPDCTRRPSTAPSLSISPFPTVPCTFCCHFSFTRRQEVTTFRCSSPFHRRWRRTTHWLELFLRLSLFFSYSPLLLFFPRTSRFWLIVEGFLLSFFLPVFSLLLTSLPPSLEVLPQQLDVELPCDCDRHRLT